MFYLVLNVFDEPAAILPGRGESRGFLHMEDFNELSMMDQLRDINLIAATYQSALCCRMGRERH